MDSMGVGVIALVGLMAQEDASAAAPW